MNYEEYYAAVKELAKHEKNKFRVPKNMDLDVFYAKIEKLRTDIRTFNKQIRSNALRK